MGINIWGNMKREEIIRMLTEGLSVEEISTVSNLEELRTLIEGSDLDDRAKKKMLRNLEHLLNETIEHSRTFTELIREVQNGPE